MGWGANTLKSWKVDHGFEKVENPWSRVFSLEESKYDIFRLVKCIFLNLTYTHFETFLRYKPLRAGAEGPRPSCENSRCAVDQLVINKYFECIIAMFPFRAN